jgi:hypothetical protein
VCGLWKRGKGNSDDNDVAKANAEVLNILSEGGWASFSHTSLTLEE